MGVQFDWTQFSATLTNDNFPNWYSMVMLSCSKQVNLDLNRISFFYDTICPPNEVPNVQTFCVCVFLDSVHEMFRRQTIGIVSNTSLMNNLKPRLLSYLSVLLLIFDPFHQMMKS